MTQKSKSSGHVQAKPSRKNFSLKKSAGASKKKVISSSSKVQGAEYWRQRPSNDKERDWGYKAENWIEDYKLSVDHPHRRLIIDALKTFEWAYLLELGCSSGPNLKLIRENFPEKALFGVDVNEESIAVAKEFLDPATELVAADMRDYLMSSGSETVDVILADASLMYIDDKDIEAVMDEIARIAKKAIIIVERFNKSKKGVAKHIWARDYLTLLEERGFKVYAQKLKPEDWPTSKGWIKDGWQFTALRQ